MLGSGLGACLAGQSSTDQRVDMATSHPLIAKHIANSAGLWAFGGPGRHRGVAEQRARDGDALLLPAAPQAGYIIYEHRCTDPKSLPAERHATLAELGLGTLW